LKTYVQKLQTYNEIDKTTSHVITTRIEKVERTNSIKASTEELSEPLEVTKSKLERTRLDLLKYLDNKQYTFGEVKEVITDSKNVTFAGSPIEYMDDLDKYFDNNNKNLI
jgi:hypothetical protein